LLIPIDTITNVTNDCVSIDRDASTLKDAPAYNPNLLNDEAITRTYRFFGSTPFWMPSHNPPPFARYFV
jgi:hypothetical protein